MLNLFQHLTKSGTYETLKRVQGDRLGFFTRPSQLLMDHFKLILYCIFLRSLEERIFIISRYFEIVRRAMWILLSFRI